MKRKKSIFTLYGEIYFFPPHIYTYFFFFFFFFFVTFFFTQNKKLQTKTNYLKHLHLTLTPIQLKGGFLYPFFYLLTSFLLTIHHYFYSPFSFFDEKAYFLLYLFFSVFIFSILKDKDFFCC